MALALTTQKWVFLLGLVAQAIPHADYLGWVQLHKLTWPSYCLTRAVLNSNDQYPPVWRKSHPMYVGKSLQVADEFT